MNIMTISLAICDEGNLYESLRYYRRFVAVHLTISPSIWSELPYEDIRILASAANKFQDLVRIDE